MIYFIDVLRNIESENTDVFERHRNYARDLYKKHKVKTIIISSGKLDSILSLEDLKYYTIKSKRRFSFRFLLKSILIISKNQTIENKKLGLITGDLNESLLSALVLKTVLKLYKRYDIRIQGQVHSDLFNPLWTKVSFINLIRNKMALFLMKYCHQIRFVGRQQFKNFLLQNQQKNIDCFISAVPLTGENLTSKKQSKQIKNIGFIGRLEVDRGIENLIEILKRTLESNQEIKIYLAGSGSQLEKIKRELSPYIDSENLNIMGYLSKKDLNRFWASIDISVFTAPFESFGRGMWESILNGVPIASFDTSGFQDLKELISRKAFLQINEKSNLFHLSTENIFISTEDQRTLDEYMKNSYQILLNKWGQLV